MSPLIQIKFTKEVISSWNKTYQNKAKVFYPKKLNDIKKFIKRVEKNKKTCLSFIKKCNNKGELIKDENQNYKHFLRFTYRCFQDIR